MKRSKWKDNIVMMDQGHLEAAAEIGTSAAAEMPERLLAAANTS